MTTLKASAVPLLAALAAGLILGISFVAQPAKFSATDVTLAQQVRIGSVIFHASHGVQAAMLLLLGAALAPTRRGSRAAWACLAVALASLLVQHLGLMPALDARVAALSVGQPLAPRPTLHAAYAGIELLKLAALLSLALVRSRA